MKKTQEKRICEQCGREMADLGYILRVVDTDVKEPLYSLTCCQDCADIIKISRTIFSSGNELDIVDHGTIELGAFDEEEDDDGNEEEAEDLDDEEDEEEDGDEEDEEEDEDEEDESEEQETVKGTSDDQEGTEEPTESADDQDEDDEEETD